MVAHHFSSDGVYGIEKPERSSPLWSQAISVIGWYGYYPDISIFVVFGKIVDFTFYLIFGIISSNLLDTFNDTDNIRV